MNEPLMMLDDRPISADQLLDLLRRNGQLKSLLQEWILEDALKDIHLPEQEEEQLLADFRHQQGLNDDEAFVSFLDSRMLTKPLLLRTLSRPHKVVLYREERWGPRVNSLYLQRKERYDCIRYHRLAATNADVMQEVYFRLKDREESWDSLARQLSPGDQSATGLIGPVAVSTIEPELLQQLRAAGEGKLLRPMQLGGATVVAQLEEVLPSEFNEELRTLLLRESFEEWLSEECSRMIQKVRFSA